MIVGEVDFTDSRDAMNNKGTIQTHINDWKIVLVQYPADCKQNPGSLRILRLELSIAVKNHKILWIQNPTATHESHNNIEIQYRS